MNSLRQTLLRAWLSVALAGLMTAADHSQAGSAPEPSASLQLIIDVSGQRNRSAAREAGETFASHVAQVFRREGYTGKISHIPREKAASQATTLVIHVTRWRIDRFGGPECHFAAALFQNETRIDLGEFSAAEMPLGAKDIARMLRWAAERPLRELVQKIRDNNLLADFAPKKD